MIGSLRDGDRRGGYANGLLSVPAASAALALDVAREAVPVVAEVVRRLPSFFNDSKLNMNKNNAMERFY